MADTMLSPDELNQRGAQEMLRGDSEVAEHYYRAALDLDPQHFPANANLVTVLSDKTQLDAALAVQHRVVKMAPTDGQQWMNLGSLLSRLERFDEAEKALDRAKELAADDGSVWYNRALLLHRTGRESEALHELSRAQALGHRGAAPDNDRAHMLLAQGRNLREALELYEARWESLMHLPPWDFYIPEWKGEDLKNKNLLFHAEQGFGDTIMCSRFVKDLTTRGAHVTLCVPQCLVPLFHHQDWIEDVIPIEQIPQETAARFHYHSPMYSAMRWLNIEWDAIDPQPFLSVPQITGPRVPKGPLNVGICWSSGKRNSDMDWRRRVSDLKLWLPLAYDNRVQLWCVNKGEAEAEISALGADSLILNRMPLMYDWADTAKFISQLDLIITVDTCIAHLAGALGLPVWMISQFVNCWRWWDIDNKSGWPWYSTMKILRQPWPGNWKDPLEECVKLLGEFER